MSEVGISIVVPVYNEAERIVPTIKTLLEILSLNDTIKEIIFVDDGSADETYDLVNSYAKQNSRIIKIIGDKKNRGKGYALRQGFSCATSPYILFTDADLSTPVDTVFDMIPYLGEYDIVIGSRKLNNSHILQNQSVLRRIVSTCGGYFRRLLLLRSIKDTQCGFKLFNKKVLADILRLSSIDGYAYDIELLTIVQQRGYKVLEFAVNWSHVDSSTFRLSFATLQILRDLFKIWTKRVFGFYNKL